MNWLEILQQIFELCIVPLLSILTGYLVKMIKQKSANLAEKSKNETIAKYAQMLSDTVTECIIATNQTYVENLKKENAFNIKEQKAAFAKTYQAVISILSTDAKKYLSEAYGDLDAYITAKIESEVNLKKGEHNDVN